MMEGGEEDIIYLVCSMLANNINADYSHNKTINNKNCLLEAPWEMNPGTDRDGNKIDMTILKYVSTTVISFITSRRVSIHSAYLVFISE